MRLTDHVTLNFNNNMSTAAVFLDIEKAFDTTLHPGLLYKLSELHFWSSLIKLISSFFSNRKFRVMFEGELSTPRVMQAAVPQGSVLVPTLYSLRKGQYNRSQRGLCSQTAATQFHQNGIVV
jgi:hypothetical protein